MSARQTKKRKGRSHVNNRERTVTTFTQDPNTSFLVPLASEEPASPFQPSFAMPYQNYISPQLYQPVLPPGKNDLEVLEKLKSIIKEGQHEFYRAHPQPAALAALYMGRADQDYPAQRFSSADNPNDATSLNNTVEPHTPGGDTSPVPLSAEAPDSNPPSAKPEPEDATTQVEPTADATGEYGARRSADAAPPMPLDTTKDAEPAGENAWERRPLDDRKVRYDDRNANPGPGRPSSYDNRPLDGDEDRRFYDRDRDRDHWDRDRDRDRHDSIRDFRDRNRDFRDRRPEFFGRSYGRSHAPRPPPELRHYEPSYGDDYVPPPRRFDPDDRRGGPRGTSFDDRPKPPPFDDRRPPLDDRRPPPPPSADDDRRPPLDDRPMRRLPGSESRTLPPSSEDRARPATESMPLTRPTAEDDRSAPATALVADDRPRANVPLEERLSQPTVTPSLQDRLSQPAAPAAVAPSRVDVAPAPSLEERLSSGPVPPRVYQSSVSVSRDDLRAPLPKDDLRDHDRINDFRTRDFSRERPTASTYRPDPDRSFGDRDDRDRRDRDVAPMDAPPARYGDAFGRAGPAPPRRYSPPPSMLDRDRERRGYYPPRSPPPFRSENAYDPDGDRRYVTDRERDAYEQRRRDWFGPGDDDKRGPPPASWRPHDRPPFMDRDRDRLDRERDRDRDFRERDRERDALIPPPPPARGQWEDRDRRPGFPLSPPPSRIDAAGVGPNRSLSARLTDPYPPPPGGDDRGYPPPREFDRGRYSGPPLDDHAHAHGHALPPPFSRVRNRSPSPPRRGPGLAEDLRPPVKRVREDGGPGYAAVGGGGAAYSPPRRPGVGGDYPPGPPPSATTSTTMTGASSVTGTVPARSTGTRTPPVSAPPTVGGTVGAFYERDQRDREREREREREYVRGEYGMGYDRDDRGRRSPPMMGRMGGGYGRGVVGDRRDDRRYVPPPPRTS